MHENHVVESNHGTKSSMCMVGYAIVLLSCVCIGVYIRVGRNNKRPTNTPKHKRPQAAESKETQQKKCLMQHEKNINII